jgi:hypothetical protein
MMASSARKRSGLPRNSRAGDEPEASIVTSRTLPLDAVEAGVGWPLLVADLEVRKNVQQRGAADVAAGDVDAQHVQAV